MLDLSFTGFDPNPTFLGSSRGGNGHAAGADIDLMSGVERIAVIILPVRA
jgi:hypothetical protein